MGFETAWLVLTVVVVAIGLLFGLQALSGVNEDIQNDPSINQVGKDASEQIVGNAPSQWDNLFLFIVIGLWAVLLIGAYVSASNPILTFIMILLGVVGLVVTMLVGNVYSEMADDQDLNDFSDNFPKMTWILNNILILAVFITFSVVLVAYATNS